MQLDADPRLSRVSAKDIVDVKKALHLQDHVDAPPGASPAVTDLVITGADRAATPGGLLLQEPRRGRSVVEAETVMRPPGQQIFKISI